MPFCPKCKSEYRKGTATCADCNISLADELFEDEQTSQEIDSASLKFITAFVSDEPEEAAAVRDILSKNNMPFVTRGEEETGFKYVDFLVREDRLEEAKRLLKNIIEQESIGIQTEYPAAIDQKEKGLNAPLDSSQKKQAKKELNNSFLLILAVVVIAAIFFSGLEKTIKYITSGILIAVIIMRLTYSREKRL